MNSTQVVGLLACVWMIIVTLVSIKGVKGIVKITSLGGLAVTSLNVVLIVISGIILVANGDTWLNHSIIFYILQILVIKVQSAC